MRASYHCVEPAPSFVDEDQRRKRFTVGRDQVRVRGENSPIALRAFSSSRSRTKYLLPTATVRRAVFQTVATAWFVDSPHAPNAGFKRRWSRSSAETITKVFGETFSDIRRSDQSRHIFDGMPPNFITIIFGE